MSITDLEGRKIVRVVDLPMTVGFYFEGEDSPALVYNKETKLLSYAVDEVVMVPERQRRVYYP